MAGSQRILRAGATRDGPIPIHRVRIMTCLFSVGVATLGLHCPKAPRAQNTYLGTPARLINIYYMCTWSLRDCSLANVTRLAEVHLLGNALQSGQLLKARLAVLFT